MSVLFGLDHAELFELWLKANGQVEQMLYLVVGRLRNSPKRVARWCGTSIEGAERRYCCYLCDEIIARDARKFKPTKRARTSVEWHGIQHVQSIRTALRVAA